MPDFTIREPETGAILSIANAAWAGQYNAIGQIVPALPTDAAFVAPIPTEIGSVVAVNPGTISPGTATYSVRIGTGTSIADFVGYIEAESGTIPAGMSGGAMAATVTVTVDRQSRTQFVASGETISGTEEVGFPADLSPSDWSWVEVDSGASGRRTGALAGTVTVPAGYQLFGYSGSVTSSGTEGIYAPGGAVQFHVEIAPGGSYTTNSGMPTGSTCYSGFIWYRESDGAYQIAHPIGDEEAFVIVGTITPPEPSDDTTYDPDSTVSSLSAMRALIVSWINNWNGTIPSGKTASDDRVIGINANTSGAMDFTDLVNSQATATTRRIFVRHVGTYTDSGCSVIHSGAVLFRRSRGIHVALSHLRVVGGNWASGNLGMRFEGAELCGATQNIIEARAISTAIPPDKVGNQWSDGVLLSSIQNNRDCTVTHNLIRYGGHPMVTMSYTDGLLFAGNMFDLVAADEIKAGDTCSRLYIERNWSTMRYQTGYSGDPHEDFFQHQGNVSLNCRFSWNVDLKTHEGKGARQTWWFTGALKGPHDLFGSRCEQNISMLTSNYLFTGDITRAGAGTRYNSIMNGGVGQYQNTPATYGGMGTRDFNYVVGRGSSGTDAAGPNGLLRDCGTPTTRDYTAMAQDFENGIPWMNANGTPKTPRTIKAFKPKVGSRIHWAHGNPCGAHLRNREIFDASYRATASAAAGYQVFPFAWPVLGAFHAYYNPDNGVTDTWTGSYDSNGFPA